MTHTVTARQAIADAATLLRECPSLAEDASRDATLLLLHAISISRAQLLADPDRILTPDQLARYDRLISRRLTCEPVQYITGEQEFYGLALSVTPDVLIPRPETEHLVESVLAEAESTQPLSVLDIGTGSGAIAIALAHHLPLARITATDISPAALELAAANAARHGLGHRIRFVESDLLEGLEEQPAPFDVIVSNPPYIAFSDGALLHPQVRDFEPAAALFATGNGLDVYRRLIPHARAALAANGLLALEIGQGQHEALAQLLRQWKDVRFVADLRQIPRVVLARRP